MNYGSVCSGVEAASLAWKPLGWTAKFYAEVEPFPAAVLCERFGATRPLRPLDPAEAHDEKDRKLRESWKKQIAGLPPVGRIPNLGDFPKIKETDYDGHIDLLVGGCPCQSYSLAGLRKGLADPRGNLTLEFVKLAYRTGARIVVFENVPGILSSGDGGSDFAGFLSLLCGWEVKPPKDGWRKCGIVTPAPGCFGVAWRILDAQYTRVPEFPRAVPQRRRRLILVGHLGSWLYPAKVLFDGEMRGGDTPPRRTKRQGFAPGPESGADPAVRPDRECIDIRQIEVRETELSPTLIATDYKGGKAVSFYPQRKAESMIPLEECSNTLVNGTCPGHQNAVCFENHGQDSRVREIPVAPPVSAKAGTGGNNLPLVMDGGEPVGFIKNDAGGEQQGYWTGAFPTIRSQVVPAVAIAENVIGRRVENGGNGVGAKEEVAYTQNCTGVMGVCQNATVRRLLPVECERLMGFPDNHTRIHWKGKPEEECPDAPRYKACGNSMCVNVMAWVGQRIQTVENEFNIAKEAYAGSY